MYNVIKFFVAMSVGLTLTGSSLFYKSTNQSENERMRNYSVSREYAIKCFGDQKEPLTEDEERAWHHCMGIRIKDEPSKENLEEFIRLIRNNIIIDDKMPHWPAIDKDGVWIYQFPYN